MYPDNYKYTDDHEWILVQGDTGRIGITDYAQKQLGDVVYVELPAVGRMLKAGESFGTVESVKAVSELFSPVAGEVVEINADLTGKPELINKDPYAGAWMIVLKVDASAPSDLMDAAAYQKYVESEAK